MDLIIFVIIVVICLALILWGLEGAPIQAPFNWIIRFLVILVAVLLIAKKAGLGL